MSHVSRVQCVISDLSYEPQSIWLYAHSVNRHREIWGFISWFIRLEKICLCFTIIGERRKPPSDKLGGEICIGSCAFVCLSLYTIYGVRMA